MKSVKQILIDAKSFIDSPDKICSDPMFATTESKECDISDPARTRACIIGAIALASRNYRDANAKRAGSHFCRFMPQHMSCAMFAAGPHEVVMATFDKAIEAVP